MPPSKTSKSQEKKTFFPQNICTVQIFRKITINNNMPKFVAVFLPRTFIGFCQYMLMRYLCQVVNNVKKRMSRASLRLYDKIGQPSLSSIAVTLSVLLYLLLTNLAALRCTISNFTWLNFCCGSHTSDV